MKTQLRSNREMLTQSPVKSLLVPTDFTEASHRAFEYALSLAAAWDARITLLHVYHDRQTQGEKISRGFFHAMEEEALENALDFFHEYQREAQLSMEKSIEVQPMLTQGFPALEIANAVQQLQVDWIVMSTEGAVSAGANQGGSIAQYLIGHTDCPIMLVPAEANYRPIEHITYAMGFEEADFPVIDTLSDLASRIKASLSCIHIRRRKSGWDQIDTRLFERLNEMAQGEDPLNFYLLNHQDVVQGLQEYISGNRVDMLAMLTHHSRGTTPNSESLTQRMGLFTDIPLLVFHV